MPLVKLFLVVVAFLAQFSNFTLASPVIQTPLGSIEGHTEMSENGREYDAFLGIPYAEPPLGALRFQKPAKKRAWSGTFLANHHVQCLQIQLNQIFGLQRVSGTEDCLVLSIYAPKVETRNLPVMVFIHGGGFVMDSGNCELYGPTRFMDEDIVLVTVNYRLGPLGFLSTGNEILPGNQAMWDQIEALKWIQENIRYFNGDPDKVTIFGESAGGMSVIGHYISKQSKGLFHRAISQSGVLNAPFLHQVADPQIHFKELAAHVGCNSTEDTKKVLECLQQADGSQIASILRGKFLHSDSDNFVPNPYTLIDDSHYSSNPFLSKDPLEIIDSGDFNDVPLIIGSNNDEGITFLPKFLPANIKEFIEQNWNAKIPGLLLGRFGLETDAETRAVMNAITQMYFDPNTEDTEENLLELLSKILTHTWFEMPAVLTSLKLAEKAQSPIYHYIFAHPPSMSFCDLIDLNFAKFSLKMGARVLGQDIFLRNVTCHADELLLLFKSCVIPMDANYSPEDKIVSTHLMKMWSDFANFGNPTPDDNTWKNIDVHNPERLRIKSELKMEKITSKEMQTWMDEIYPKHPPHMRSRVLDICALSE